MSSVKFGTIFLIIIFSWQVKAGNLAEEAGVTIVQDEIEDGILSKSWTWIKGKAQKR